MAATMPAPVPASVDVARRGGAEGLEEERPLHVAFVSTPHAGHMVPVMHLAAAVVKRGHHARILTCDWGVPDYERQAREAAAELVPLSTGAMTRQALYDLELKHAPFPALREVMRAPLRTALAKERPDVIVADFAAFAGTDVAAELGIPLVVNIPGPVSIMGEMLGWMDESTHRSCLGLHFARSALTPVALGIWANMMDFGDFARALREYARRGPKMLVQTVWGLDVPRSLPPHIVVTGPILPPAGDLRRRLVEGHRALAEFLDAPGPGGVVYVTTGSLAELRQWQVEEIYRGLKQAGCRVVWSLKEAQQQWLPRADDPSFHVSAWTPQAELLQHEAIEIVITHCGWGGTLECIAATKPVVAIPFFSDQPGNAMLLINAGAAEPIGRFPGGFEKNGYRPGDFTAESLAAAVTRIRADYPRYKQAMARLTRSARTTGGAELAARHVEWTARYGNEFLVPPGLRHTMGNNPVRGVLVGAAMGLLALALAWARTAKFGTPALGGGPGALTTAAEFLPGLSMVTGRFFRGLFGGLRS